MNAVLDQMRQQSQLAAVPTATPGAANALTQVEQQRAIAETQSKIFLAKQFPRDQIASLERILLACARPSLAEKGLYSYQRGGTDITGPSIRLAEAIAQNWGNLEFGIRELEQRNGESIVEAYAWDMETNVSQKKSFAVKHLRHTKRGSYALEDPRDIYEMVANNGARRLRACILGIIPGDVIEAATEQAKDTLTKKFEITPENIKGMLESFQQFGVTKEMIEKRMGRKIESITPAIMVQFNSIRNSLNDGMSTAGDWFETTPPPETKSATDAVTETLKKSLKPQENLSPEINQQPGLGLQVDNCLT